MKSGIVILLATIACATSQAPQTKLKEQPLSPLRVADRLPDTIAFFGIDPAASRASSGGIISSAAATRVSQPDPAIVRTFMRAQRDSGARVLERAGYHVRLVSGGYERLDRYTSARLAIIGRLLDLDVASTDAAPSDSETGDSTTVRVRIEWTLFDVDAHLVALRATHEARVTGSAALDATVAASTAATLAAFIAKDSVRSALPFASRTLSPTSWRRTLPATSDVISLTSQDANVDARGSVLDGAISGVVSIRGSTGVGSAFVLSRDGLALTNFHVVRKQRSLIAKFRDGTVAPVRVVRTDSTADLALLEVACTTDCFTIDLGNGIPPLGDDVYAIGSPVSEQFSHSVTKGIVSSVRQQGTERMIQTDAAMNRGNSGGPLVEARTARAVGIVSRKLMIDGVEGIGFAIVLDDALRLLGVHREAAP